MKKSRFLTAGIAVAVVLTGFLVWPAPEPVAAGINCHLQCDLLAAKYSWTQEMIDNCHYNCTHGNGACPFPEEECEPDDDDD